MDDITIRFKFSKEAGSRYLSHLDVLKLMARAIARSGMHVSYTAGFNPRPMISFSNPIPLGVDSFAEYCDIRLDKDIDHRRFLRILDSKLPPGFGILEGARYTKKIPSLMSEISHVLFEFGITGISRRGGYRDLISRIDSAVKEYNQIFDSIYDHDISMDKKNIIFLKVFGYAKIFRYKNNNIFKYNGFTGFLSHFLGENDMGITSSCKKEVFFFKDDKLITPLEVL